MFNFFNLNYAYYFSFNSELDLFNFNLYINNLFILIKKTQDLLNIFKNLIVELFQYERFNQVFGEFKFIFFINDFLFLKIQ